MVQESRNAGANQEDDSSQLRLLFAVPQEQSKPGASLLSLSKKTRGRKQKPQAVGKNFWQAKCDRCEMKGKMLWFRHASPYVVIKRLRERLEQEHDLECYFCFARASSFKELADHVNDCHVSATAKAERENREAWHPLDDKENDDMALPQPGGGKRQSERGSGGGGGGRKPPAVPFLRVEDLTEEPSRAKILGLQTQNTGFNDVIVKVAIRGKSYFFGLKASNPNYDALFNAFGGNENEWVGREFLVGLNFNEFYEKQFVHVFEAPAPDKKSKK